MTTILADAAAALSEKATDAILGLEREPSRSAKPSEVAQS
jgi:hypothetical protein